MESEHARMLYQHDKDLYRGNGKPGLTQRMATVEKDVSLLLEKESKKEAKADRMEFALWSAVLVGIINLIVWRFQH